MAGGPPLRRLSQQRVRVYTLDPHVRRLQHPGLQTSRQRCRFVAGGTPQVSVSGAGREVTTHPVGGVAQGRSWCHPGPCRSSVENARCATQCSLAHARRDSGRTREIRTVPRGGALARSVGAAWQGSPKDAPNRLPGFPASSEGTLVARLLWSPASLTRDRPLWSGALGFTILPLRVGPGDFAVG